MTYKSLIIFATSLALPVTAYAGATNNCEVVVLQTVVDTETEDATEVAGFHPGADFIDSIYDDEDGYLTDIDGDPVKAVMCQRPDIIPTLRDFPILETGLPLSLSDNFDNPESGLMTVYYKAGEFKYKYDGEEMGAYAQSALDDAMEVFNLQPHDLPKAKESQKRLSEAKQRELE